MKCTHLAPAALLAASLAAPALGQPLSPVSPAGSTRSPALVQDHDYDYEYCYQEGKEKTPPSPSDSPGAPALEPAVRDALFASADDRRYAQRLAPAGVPGCSSSLCGPAERWTLLPELCCGTIAGGWTQLGYSTEGANGVGTGLFNNRPNQVQLQQAWAYVERPVAEGECGQDWGFRVDYVYGTDGPNTQAFGGRPGEWDNPWDCGPDDLGYGSAIPQLYVEFAYNQFRVKTGHFYSIVGYETVPAPHNFLYSHSYTFALAEPLTHTGVLAERPLGRLVTLCGGWTAGWDTGFTRNGGGTFLGGASLQLTRNAALTYAATIGDFGYRNPAGAPGSDSDGYSHSIVLDWDVTDRLKYIFQTDYVDNRLYVANIPVNRPSLNPVLGSGGTGKVSSINQYLLYSLNRCWAAGIRGEWFNVGGYDVGEVSLGVNWRPHANVVLRPELRVDFFEEGIQRVFGARDSTLFCMDAIVTF
jgi:hypothetical protein